MRHPWTKNDTQTMMDMLGRIQSGTAMSAEGFISEFNDRTGIPRTAGALGITMEGLFRSGIVETTEPVRKMQRLLARLSSANSSLRVKAREEAAKPTIKAAPVTSLKGRFIDATTVSQILAPRYGKDAAKFVKSTHRGYYSYTDLMNEMMRRVKSAQAEANFWLNCLDKLKAVPITNLPAAVPNEVSDKRPALASILKSLVAKGQLSAEEALEALTE